MKMLDRLFKIRATARRADSVLLLLLRLNMGMLFAASGWGKIHDLESVTSFFTELHIPFPAFNAGLTPTTELVGGSLLIIGLASRLAALPLAFTMLIAILTAKLADIDGIAALATTDELTYGLVLLAIAVFGPGKLALDYFVDEKLSGAAR